MSHGQNKSYDQALIQIKEKAFYLIAFRTRSELCFYPNNLNFTYSKYNHIPGCLIEKASMILLASDQKFDHYLVGDIYNV